MTNFSIGARCGFRSAIAAATVLPVAIRSTWPETKRGDGGVVILEAFDGGVGGAIVRQRLLFDRAARGADRLAG